MDKMFNPLCYKKPTPTDIINITQLDFLSRSLFREILAMCRTKPDMEVFWHGNKQFSVNLEKGQMILKIRNIADQLKISTDMINKRLKLLNEIYTEIYIQGMPYGSIITLKDYDALIKMNEIPVTKSATKQFRNNNEAFTSNKSVKTNKSDIYKENFSYQENPFERLTQQYNPTSSLVEN